MVGAVLVRDGVVLGLGHHRRFGGLHAEREALADCRRRGNDPRGCTSYITLEPCGHHGKQPPCTDALIEAGVARVVYARPDPHEASGGGAAVLERAGIPCDLCTDSPLATHLADPFVKRVTTGLPWVIAKWAQTTGGRMTTPPVVSPWISNTLSLRRVHRLRARVDAIVTGIGTVLADDPLLTARGVARVRRVAIRVVIEGERRLPPACRLLQSLNAAPLLVATRHPDPPPPRGGGDSPRQCESGEVRIRDDEPNAAAHLPRPRGLGHPLRKAEGDQTVQSLLVSGCTEGMDLRALLRLLVERRDVTTILLECGPSLLASFFGAGLVDEALVYVAPPSVGASWKPAPPDAPDIAAMPGFTLIREKPLAGDTERWYRRLG